MRVDVSFIAGFMIGIESADDYDFGGQMIVLDLGIFRFLIKFGELGEV